MPRNPVSEKQFAANRANAARSTGPRTPVGKATSAQNARKHGFTATNFAVVRLEDLREVAHLRADLIHCYQPANSQELLVLERIALAQQAMLRVARLEAGLLTTCFNQAVASDGQPFLPMSQELVGDGDIEITRGQNRGYAVAEGFRRMTMNQKSNTWPLFLRYKTQTEREYRRAREEFQEIKALRNELPNEPILETQPEENEPAPPPQTNPSRPLDSAPASPADLFGPPHPAGSPQQSTPANGIPPAARVRPRHTARAVPRPGFPGLSSAHPLRTGVHANHPSTSMPAGASYRHQVAGWRARWPRIRRSEFGV